MRDKVLFGTDYPFTTIQAKINGLHKLNSMLEGMRLQRLDVGQIDAMIRCDSLRLLGA